MSQELDDEPDDERTPFDLETLGMSKNWMLNIFRDAVRSNNYPVIGLFFVGFATIMRMAGSDFTVGAFNRETVSENPILNWLFGGFFKWPFDPTASINVSLSTLLTTAGIGLMGAPLIGKLASVGP